MHGQEETTKVPRIAWTIAHLCILAVSAWILFGGGISVVGKWVGEEWTAGDPMRRALLLGLGGVLWIRMSLTAFVLLERKFGWEEAGPVISAVALYQLGFALLGATNDAPAGVLAYAGVAVYLLGSYLNTGSEYQRKLFKAKPENKGKIYTGGLFAYARHINYFGDVCWAAGWAMVTGNAWSTAIPVALLFGFVFMFIPPLHKYLSEHYGQDYVDWTKKSKKIIPFIY